MIKNPKVKISMLVICRDIIKWALELRGTRNINRDCEKPKNISADLQSI
jgi:hypothetical protein